MFNLISSLYSFIIFLTRKSPMDSIVFYSEGNAYKPFLFPLMKEVGNKYNLPIFYLTSDPNDTVLSYRKINFRSFYIGKGLILTLTLYFLKTRILFMTMPDLNLFHIKKSIYPVHYSYLQHSLVSTHMVYREGAFDHFDSIFCSGFHHLKEIREWEKINNLPPKKLFKHGYLPLDTIILQNKKNVKLNRQRLDQIRVLIAPSWGQNGLIHNGIENLLENLLSNNFFVTIRLHPQSKISSKKQISVIKDKFHNLSNFAFDDDNSVFDILYKSDILITDWSGIAFEFSFGLLRPVIFIDVNKKVNNPRYNELKSLPVEVTMRNEIGLVISFKDNENLAQIIKNYLKKIDKTKTKVTYFRDKYVYNIGKSVEVGSKIIFKLFNELKEK